MAGYRDDQGEMDGIGERPLRDFLGPSEHLVRCRDMVKVTLALNLWRVDSLSARTQRQSIPHRLIVKELAES